MALAAPTRFRRGRGSLTLAVLASTLLLAGIDASVLNVAIPSMLDDLDASVASLQWVPVGYSLTIASFLVIGGRLGDVYGYRRLFLLGVSLFGLGSLITATARGVPALILGESVIQGIGSALMMPSTLAILSTTFQGRARARAFAAWGAVMGASVCFGPPLGGFLTTNYSWRWAFAINVVLAPLAVFGGLVVIDASPKRTTRSHLDVTGAALASIGTLLVVLALTQSPSYGWWRARRGVELWDRTVWSATWPISASIVIGAIGLALLGMFTIVERRKASHGREPILDLGLLRIRTFRCGVLTSAIFALGQYGLLFCLPLYLQRVNGLTAEENGLWLLPLGLSLLAGAKLGGWLIVRTGTARLVQIGFLIEGVALGALVASIGNGLTLLEVVPVLSVYGLGAGFATSQLTNLVLGDVPASQAGSASGANSTARQVGSAFGIAIIGTLLAVVTVSDATARLEQAPLADASLRREVQVIDQKGPAWTAADADPDSLSVVEPIFAAALGVGSQCALSFAALALVGAAFLVARARDGRGPPRPLDDAGPAS